MVVTYQVPDGVHVFVAVCFLHHRRIRGESWHRPILYGDRSRRMVRYRIFFKVISFYIIL